MINKIDALQACESTCHECTSKYEVENFKEDIVVEKGEFIMKKDMKNKKIPREKKNMKINNKVFHIIKLIYEKVIEVNNDLKLNVDEQQDDLKHLKEQCDIDDENEVQEVTAARNLMKRNKAVYVTCNQTFAMKNWLKLHIQEEHTEIC